MLIRIGHELVFDLQEPVAMTLMLSIHPSRASDIRAYCSSVDPEVPVHTFTDSFGNLCGRVLAPAGKIRFFTDGIVEDSGMPDVIPTGADAEQCRVEDLPDECLQFLLSSRYCEVDKMVPIAWDMFGGTNPGWERVQAILDYVHSKITFGYAFARPTKSAFDAYAERMGVCRDFAHTALTFCRCMNIPARYTTGYLGDFGAPPLGTPMDFSGWFEVFLGGKWHTADARHNKPRIGRIVMARGRDATDVALTTSYGAAPLVGFKVVTEVVGPEALDDFRTR